MGNDKPSLEQDVLDQLAYMRVLLEELLRRVPDHRCAYCGEPSSLHSRKFGNDHEFMP